MWFIKRIFLFAVLIGLPFTKVDAQFVKEAALTDFIHATNKSYPRAVPVFLDEVITSVAVRIHPDDTFSGSYLITGGDTFELSMNEHANNNNKYQTSNLIMFSEPIKEFKVLTGEGIKKINEVSLFFIYAPPIEPVNTQPKKKTFQKVVLPQLWLTSKPGGLDYLNLITQES